jgi:hypothetical protein
MGNGIRRRAVRYPWIREDAGDLHGLVAEAVEKYVLAASETPATCDEIFPGFTAGKKWIGHDAFASK